MSTPRIEQVALAVNPVSTTASMTGTATRTSGTRLDALEHLLGESGLAGRDLQLRPCRRCGRRSG